MVISTETLKELITDLESYISIKFSNKVREIIEFIATKNYDGIGITVKYLETQFNYKKHYAEKLIYELKGRNIITPTEIREGHMMTYFLSNMQDYIPVQDNFQHSKKRSLRSGSNSDDQNILDILFKELSIKKGLFHDFRLLTNLVESEDYDRIPLSGECRWVIQSVKNKAKIKKIKLSSFRTARLQVSPNGTVEIYISCSKNPYDLHYDKGLSEFMFDLGIIQGVFQSELKLSQPLDQFYNWHLLKIDYNFDVEGLDVSYLASGKGILQVKHLSHLYQFYIKQLPNKGLVLRLEEIFSFSQPYPTVEQFTNSLRFTK
ncbi:hypothetical protein [Candidatus Nitrosocosmicus hydrocola]|uniref:hypothetical protein n=1 Tax=Candidatus Nitrosocosmicus hydrocola TaxID=1826872 RepID=UPI0011E5F686|nr:hypothetical protein [Candidatus Nitrosocosmicus hydrocola]